MKLRYKNILYFVLLSSFLFGCFFLRAIDRHFEVFPSVTLPSFASQINLDKAFVMSQRELYGVDLNGNRKRLDHAKFFKNIPKQFARSIMVNSFGLDANKPKQRVTNRFNLGFRVKPKVTLEEIEETKLWLRNRLTEQGCNDSILIIEKRKITVHADGTHSIAKLLENDTIYKLGRR